MNDQNQKIKSLSDRIEHQQEIIFALGVLVGVMFIFNAIFWAVYFMQ